MTEKEENEAATRDLTELGEILKNVYDLNFAWDARRGTANIWSRHGWGCDLTYYGQWYIPFRIIDVSVRRSVIKRDLILGTLRKLAETKCFSPFGSYRSYSVLLPNVETLSELKLKLELSGIDWERPLRWENAEERQKYPTIFSEGE